jgi:HEPN domain-containing protein
MKNSNLNTQRWVKEAETDLKMSELSFEKKIYNMTCFHCEQAVQKILKAFLYFKGERFINIHSPKILAENCKKYDDEFSLWIEKCAEFDKYYISTRYPDAVPYPATPSEIYTEKEAKEALNIAKQIYKFVKSKIRL